MSLSEAEKMQVRDALARLTHNENVSKYPDAYAVAEGIAALALLDAKPEGGNPPEIPVSSPKQGDAVREVIEAVEREGHYWQLWRTAVNGYRACLHDSSLESKWGPWARGKNPAAALRAALQALAPAAPQDRSKP